MPDTQIVAASLSVDVGSSSANIKEVNKNLTDVKTSLKDTGAIASDTGKAIEGSSGSFGKLKDQMSGLPGPLGQAGEGVNKLSSAFKALLLNPVVAVIAAIVAGLALLYAAFKNTFEGGEKMEQVFAGIKAAGQALLDSLGHIAQAAVDLFHFDFSKAVDEIKAVGTAAVDAYSKMSNLVKESQGLHREQLQNDLDQAEREKKLSKLRADAYDDSIPIAKRKALLKELQKDAEENAKTDIDLAKRTTENFIKQKTLEKDGALKNQDEINAAKIKQIQVETDNANELFRIGKQVTRADAQERTEQKAAATEARNAAKEARQKLVEFNNQLRKVQNENELLEIKDGYAKELKALELKIADQKRLNLQAFNDGKLTRSQYNAINLELEKNAILQRDALTDKHNKELATKEEAFQKDLNTIVNKTKLDGIRDAREVEKVQLQISHEEKLQAAIKQYKDDAIKFQAIKNALDKQLKAEQDKLDAKNKKEDDKKKFDLAAQNIKNGPGSLVSKIKAEQALVQKAFDDKVLSELDYNSKIKSLSDERIIAAKTEADARLAFDDSIGNSLTQLSEIIGKQTVVGKALAIASIIAHQASTIGHIVMDTEAANMKAIAASPLTAGMPWVAINTVQGFISGAASIAAGVKAVSALGGSGGGSASMPAIGSSPGGASMAAPLAPTQTSTLLNANYLNNQNNATVKAYVLDSDINSHRERDIRLNRCARLGG